MMPAIITMATMVAVTLPLSHSLWQGSFGFVTNSLSGSRCVMVNLLTHVVVNAGCLPRETFPPPPRAPTFWCPLPLGCDHFLLRSEPVPSQLSSLLPRLEGQ